MLKVQPGRDYKLLGNYVVYSNLEIADFNGNILGTASKDVASVDDVRRELSAKKEVVQEVKPKKKKKSE